MYYLFLRVYKHSSRFILKELSDVSLWSYLLDLVLMYCRHWVLELRNRVFSRACKFFIVKGYHRNFRSIHIIFYVSTLFYLNFETSFPLVRQWCISAGGFFCQNRPNDWYFPIGLNGTYIGVEICTANFHWVSNCSIINRLHGMFNSSNLKVSHKVADWWIVIVKILFQIESRNFDRFWEKWWD